MCTNQRGKFPQDYLATPESDQAWNSLRVQNAIHDLRSYEIIFLLAGFIEHALTIKKKSHKKGVIPCMPNVYVK